MYLKKNIDLLLKYESQDCIVDLQEEAQPLFVLIYNLSQNIFFSLNNLINKSLSKNFIQYSKFLASAPIFFVKKINETLLIYKKYCGLNKLTIKKCHSQFLILELIDQLNKAKVYTKIYLHESIN